MRSSVFIAVCLCAILAQGCVAQILGEQLKRGPLVKEEGTGAYSEPTVRHRIELLSPSSVRAYDEITSTEVTKKFYEKLVVRREARPKSYPYLDFWLKVLASTTIVPVLFPDFWVEGSYLGVDCKEKPAACSVRERTRPSRNDYFIETGSRQKQKRLIAPSTSTVSLYINGRYEGPLALDSQGTATADLAHYAGDVPPGAVKLTFRYIDAYAYSLLQPDAAKSPDPR